jgi:hypothetical protein
MESDGRPTIHRPASQTIKIKQPKKMKNYLPGGILSSPNFLEKFHEF